MRGKCVEFFFETFTKHVLLIDSLINARSHVRPQSELYKIFFNWDAPHCVKLIVNIPASIGRNPRWPVRYRKMRDATLTQQLSVYIWLPKNFTSSLNLFSTVTLILSILEYQFAAWETVGKNFDLQKTAYKIRHIFWTLFRTLDWCESTLCGRTSRLSGEILFMNKVFFPTARLRYALWLAAISIRQKHIQSSEWVEQSTLRTLPIARLLVP